MFLLQPSSKRRPNRTSVGSQPAPAQPEQRLRCPYTAPWSSLTSIAFLPDTLSLLASRGCGRASRETCRPQPGRARSVSTRCSCTVDANRCLLATRFQMCPERTSDPRCLILNGSLHTSRAQSSVLILLAYFLPKHWKEPYQHQRYLKKELYSYKRPIVAYYKIPDVKIVEILKENAATQICIEVREVLKIHTLVR